MFMRLLVKFPRKGSDFDFVPEIICVKYRHHGSNSYQNVERQLLMTVQVLERLSPLEIKSKAIGYKLSYYVLYALYKRRFGILLRLFCSVPRKSWGWCLVGLVKMAFNGLKQKCRV